MQQRERLGYEIKVALAQNQLMIEGVMKYNYQLLNNRLKKTEQFVTRIGQRLIVKN